MDRKPASVRVQTAVQVGAKVLTTVRSGLDGVSDMRFTEHGILMVTVVGDFLVPYTNVIFAALEAESEEVKQ